jgi:hypothetical protein
MVACRLNGGTSSAAQRTTIALVPPGYRGVATALNRRIRETLSAIYVL